MTDDMVLLCSRDAPFANTDVPAVDAGDNGQQEVASGLGTVQPGVMPKPALRDRRLGGADVVGG